MEKPHKAGFVSIIGKPNAGKSTLMNQLVGERLSIITAKAQTTRHRIMGIMSGDDYQIVYSDTPGIIDPRYELQRSMMNFVNAALEDADILLLVVDAADRRFNEARIKQLLENVTAKVIVVLNKVDLLEQKGVMEMLQSLQNLHPKIGAVIPVSALHGFNAEAVLQQIHDSLPEHPPFFPKNELTDKPMRFFASEIIREKIFINYKQEVPYACEVMINLFKEEGNLIRISADIVVERQSQKGILIGKQGMMLKKIGMQARKDLEAFFGKKIFLEQYVKVDSNWRQNKTKLSRFGYV